MQDQNLVLVTYKGKILLSAVDSPFEDCVWSLIGDKGKWSKSRLESVVNSLKSLTKLNSLPISRISLTNTDENYIYFTKLTDKNVNSIVRRDGQRLEFYRIEEIEKLPLSQITGNLLSQFKSEIVKLVND